LTIIIGELCGQIPMRPYQMPGSGYYPAGVRALPREEEPEINETDELYARHYRIAEGADTCQNCAFGYRPADGPLFWCRDTDSPASPSHVCDAHKKEA